MKKFLLIIGDGLFLIFLFYLSSYLHWGDPYKWITINKIISKNKLIIVLINILILYFNGLYNERKFFYNGFLIIRTFISQLTLVFIFSFIMFFFRVKHDISRYLVIYYFIFSIIFLIFYRKIYLISFGYTKELNNVIIIARKETLREIFKSINIFKIYRFKIAGYISLEDENNKDLIINNFKIKYLGCIKDVKKIIKNYKNSKLIIFEHQISPETSRILEDLILRNYEVDILPEFYEFIYGKVQLDLFINLPIIKFEIERKEFYFFVKRIIDIISSLIFLILSFPVLLIFSIIIPLESKGSPFYLQERVGKNGRIFKIIKFRSMIEDAEKYSGPTFSKGEKDPRITKIGKFLRKTRIDELPQLFCVLIGTMSLVGPRPERPVFVEKYEKKIPFYNLRHLVKPGITGWAQINYDYSDDIDSTKEKLKYDLYYIKNMSLEMDFEIIIKTIKVILQFKGK